MPVIELVYETHSTTIDNETGNATGWLAGELSAAGREQAVELGSRRSDADAIFTSDLGRALETVAIAFAERDVPIFHDWRLRECNYGALNGAPVGELEVEKHVDVPFPGGESYRDVVARVDSFLADLRGGWEGKRIVVVSHAAPRWALQHLLERTPLDELVGAPFEWQAGWKFCLDPP
jgi:alpha-ribazole phosphatase/probable phosphoglycerate mutase